jgi:predicted naringenin-chalcone synthase
MTHSAHLLSVATQRPEHWISQADAAAVAVARCCETPQQERLLPALYRRSMVKRRGSVLLNGSNGHNAGSNAVAFYPPAEGSDDRGPTTAARMQRYAADALPMALGAASRALQLTNLQASDIDQLVVVSCTGFMSPGIDVMLIRELGLRPTTGRTIVGFMGCHGAVNGMRVARAMARDGDNVLLCAIELCSLHFHYGWDPERIVANALFADGAAAAIVSPRPGPDSATTLVDTASCLIPDSEDAMSWVIGDHGFEMTLSPRVPLLIQTHLRPWLSAWLAGHGLAIGDVGVWAVHPGGPRVVDAVDAALDLPHDATQASREVLAECGNMSSPTLLFILDRLRRQAMIGPCVLLGFGPGLMAEAALVHAPPA